MATERWPQVDVDYHRMVFRPAHDFLVRAVARLTARHDRDVVCGVTWMALLQASRGSATEAPWTPRPVGVRQLARSLNFAHETVRRKLLLLEQAGLCIRTPDGGCMVTAEALNGAGRRQVAATDMAALKAVTARIAVIGLDLVALAGGQLGPPPADPELAAQALIEDFILRTIEVGADVNGSLIDTVILAGLNVLNAEPLAYDNAAWNYAGAHTPPPEAARVGVPVAQVAAMLNLPRETVRRRISHAVERGWVEHAEDGYRMGMARQQEPEMMHVGGAVARQFLVLLANLRQIGCDLTPPAPLPA